MSKARQIGVSTVIAAEGLHSAATRSQYSANFISVNEKEAKGKILTAKSLYHSIPQELSEQFYNGLPLKPVIWNDAEDTLGFHHPPSTSLLVSQPASSAIRGGQKDIYFDEAAHIRDFAKLYQAALPAITRGESRITVVSTPMDMSGLFHDIIEDVEGYPQYSRHYIPWWESLAMCKNELYEEAQALAPVMSTHDRVAKYATDKMKLIYSSFGRDIEAFKTEYECEFVDELEAFFPWDTIVNSRDDEMLYFKGDIPSNWEPVGSLTLGIDLAKQRDESVFTLVEALEDENGAVHRYVRWLHATQIPYQEQVKYINDLIQTVKPARVSVDQTGVGAVIVEQLPNVEGVVFTQAKKERWATTFKSELQRGYIHIPPDKTVMDQIHGIKRTKTEGGLFKFAGKKDDYFWSLILACYGEGRAPLNFRFL